MPDISGLEVYRQIAVRHPEQVDVFAFLTAGAGSPEFAEFAKTDIPALQKPVSIRDLEATIHELSKVAKEKSS